MREACARIVRTTLGRHEHYGIWAAELRVEYVTDAPPGAPVIIGGHGLDTKPGGDGRRHGTAWGMEFLIRLLDAVPSARSWEDLPGKLITVFLGDARTGLGLRPAVGIGPALDSRESGGRERWERACFMFADLPTDEEAAERLAALERAAANALGSIEAVSAEHRSSLGIDQARGMLRTALGMSARRTRGHRDHVTVHVVGYVGDGAVGGFDWDYFPDKARERLATAEVGYWVGPVDVPAGLTIEGTTEWLNERPELWDRPPGVIDLVHTSGARGRGVRVRLTPETSATTRPVTPPMLAGPTEPWHLLRETEGMPPRRVVFVPMNAEAGTPLVLAESERVVEYDPRCGTAWVERTLPPLSCTCEVRRNGAHLITAVIREASCPTHGDEMLSADIDAHRSYPGA